MPYTFGSIEDADYIITDATVPEEFARAAKDAGAKLL